MYIPKDIHAADETPIACVIQRKRRSPQFIKGPLPLIWFERAAHCSPAAVKVGLLLFYFHGLGRTEITLSNELARRFKISRNTKTGALRALEETGLIRLRRTGQRVIVSLLEVGVNRAKEGSTTLRKTTSERIGKRS